MSADYWTTCPRCLRRAQEARAQEEASVAASYGKVPAAEFMAATERLAANPLKVEETLPVYAETGVTEDGEAYVSLGAECRSCGLKVKLAQTVRLDISDEAPNPVVLDAGRAKANPR